jgi:hypothetical protein
MTANTLAVAAATWPSYVDGNTTCIATTAQPALSHPAAQTILGGTLLLCF